MSTTMLPRPSDGPGLFRLLAPAALGLAMLVPGDARCQIYVGTDSATGAVVLSNFRSDDAASVVEGTAPPAEAAASAAPPAAASAPGQALANIVPSVQMRALVDSAARTNKLPPALIHAVITAESRYDPRAVSAKGAIGLMQLMPTTGKRFGARDLYSAEQNVAAGASYLRWLMALFDGHLDLVLAAYNAGEQAVIQAGCRVPAYPETQAYVKKILDRLGPQSASSWRAAAGGGCA